MDLNIVWFLLLGVVLAVYAILDGFDLGIGILHPLARGENERRTMINAIAPIWDGNEVWLVTFGGALFAAFPLCYATAFSGFYTAFMLLLCALIFRAISMEFRGKFESPIWRVIWDYAFFAGSFTVALLFGVATGNILQGMPIGADGELRISFFGLLRPFPLLSGLLTVCALALHGSFYGQLKTDGPLRERLAGVAKPLTMMHALFYVLTSVYALTSAWGGSMAHLLDNKIVWLAAVIHTGMLALMWRAVKSGRPGLGFLASSIGIAALVGLFGAGLYPNMLISSLDTAYNLTIYTSASTTKTLRIMFIIVCMGLPLVIIYTGYIYWVFRGKVKLEPTSY